MKKKIVCVMLAALSLCLAVPAAAAPSIGQIVPEAPKVISGNLSGNQELVVQNVDTSAYANKTVADVVEKANDDDVQTTVKELLTELDYDTKAETKTVTNKKVNPVLYEQLTSFVDVAIKENDKLTYETTGAVKVSVTFEAAKERERKELLIMQINPTTGAVTFSSVESLNKTTGELTTTLTSLGPVALLEKVPIVVKDVSPELYADETTAAVVTEYREESQDISLQSLLTSITDLTKLDTIATKLDQDIDITNPVVTLTLSDDTKVELDLTKYDSAMGLADLAIKQGLEEYLYDMDGNLTADANREITDNVDWERIVTEGNTGVDVEAVKENPDLLTQLDHFTIEDSIVVQIDPTDGVVDIIYEPELYFAYPTDYDETIGEETTEGETEETTETTVEETTEAADSETDVEGDDEDELMNWDVEDEDREYQEYPNLIIRGDYKSMGPFALFLKNAE